MIGFFDSGFGGLTIARSFSDLAPHYDTVFLGDNARTPYGARSEEVIYRYTVEGVSFLFSRGADIVILACNTASAAALRRIQQEWLPAHHPDKHVLGIIIPTVEDVISVTKGRIGVLATSATVHSRSFTNEVHKKDASLAVTEKECPLFVPIIEEGESDWEGTRLIARKYIRELFEKDPGIDSVVLGCTHYALIYRMLREEIPSQIAIISQGEIVAKKLIDYLDRHSEVERRLSRSGMHQFYSTERSPRITHLASKFYGRDIVVEVAQL